MPAIPALLLKRLDDIGQSLARSRHALALIGLGSVGNEMARLDEFSDLDFFAIVETGHKRRYLENLDWLEAPCPAAYHFQNTVDGYKLLYSDGIFCEFAVFEPHELEHIPFAPGRVVWKRDDAPENIHIPVKTPAQPKQQTKEYLIGEALTNLYTGLGRDKRGERLAAMRFIQVYAVDRSLELTENIEPGQGTPRDLFAIERRFEARHPLTATALSSWVQGYERNRESALAILSFLEEHFEINAAMAKAIRDLCR